MTARRALVAALIAAAHTALGGAVLAAVVGALWTLGSAWLGPNAGHGFRVVMGGALAVVAVGALYVAVEIIRAAHTVGRAISDAIAERRR